MVLISFDFLIFLLILFLIYYIIPKRFQWWILLAASCVFYLSAGKRQAVFLAFTGVVIYLGALLIAKIADNQQKWEAQNRERLSREERMTGAKSYERKKQLTVVLAVVLAFGPLAFLKYFNFLAQNINSVSSIFGTSFSIPTLKLILPLGISFYTFQAVGYLIDVYRGVCEPQKNPFKLGLYVAFFPSVSQGPINCYYDLFSQLLAPHKFDYNQVTFGVQRILWGFFKKLVIADRIMILVNTVYNDPNTYPGFYVIVAIIAFAIQIYADFSGCIDIVIGAAQVFGIILPENFQTPFFSRSISEFWRRWHITLGGWMKYYLFYPLLKSNIFQYINKVLKKYFGKKFAKKIITYTGLLILWMVIGFWHGSSWKFILGTGFLNWIYIVFEDAGEPFFVKAIRFLKIKTNTFSWRLFQMLRTFILVSVMLLFFRARSFKIALSMLLSIVRQFNPWVLFDKSLLALGLDGADFVVLSISLLALLIVSILQQNYHIRQKLAEQNLVFRWIVYIGLFFVVVIYGIYGPGYNATDFIYEQF